METPDADIIISVTPEGLKLNYLCKTSQVNYSISDLTGNIVQLGNYDCLVESIVPISQLSAGTYILCIIDGDEFCQIRFKKNSL